MSNEIIPQLCRNHDAAIFALRACLRPGDLVFPELPANPVVQTVAGKYWSLLNEPARCLAEVMPALRNLSALEDAAQGTGSYAPAREEQAAFEYLQAKGMFAHTSSENRAEIARILLTCSDHPFVLPACRTAQEYHLVTVFSPRLLDIVETCPAKYLLNTLRAAGLSVGFAKLLKVLGRRGEITPLAFASHAYYAQVCNAAWWLEGWGATALPERTDFGGDVQIRQSRAFYENNLHLGGYVATTLASEL